MNYSADALEEKLQAVMLCLPDGSLGLERTDKAYLVRLSSRFRDHAYPQYPPVYSRTTYSILAFAPIPGSMGALGCTLRWATLFYGGKSGN